MYDVVAVGEPVIDFEATGSREHPAFRANVGGGSLNVLAAIAAQGGRTELLGCVGDDMFGEYLLSDIRRHGIGYAGVKVQKGRNTGIGFVALNEEGDYETLLYRDGTTPVNYYLPEDARIIDNAKIVHYTSVSMAGLPGRESTRKAAQYAKDAGIPLSFDVNYRPGLWPDVEEARNVFETEISRAMVVKMNEIEAELITGEKDPKEAARQVLKKDVALVLITLGKHGSYFAFDGGEGFCEAIPVHAVDTTGCGDAFMGTMLYELVKDKERFSAANLKKEEIERSVRRANAAGALCSLQKGSVDCMPSKQELDDAINDLQETR